VIVRDAMRGFDRLEELKCFHNRRRILQTFLLHVLRSWQLIVMSRFCFTMDPTNPDTMELAKVTDYVVSYGSKGTEHATEEEKQRLE
jgi:hypothetical protein